MILYILIFIAAVVLYDLTKDTKKKSVKKTAQQQNFVFACFMIFLAVFVGVSDMLGGYDRYIYSQVFDNAADTLYFGENPLTAYIFQEWPREYGYSFFNLLIGYFTRNRYIFILITTFVIYINYYYSIKKYTENNIFALILFLGLMFFFTFTYLRQMLGVGIAWMSIQFIWQRKFWPFLGIMIVAFLFHNSAVVLFPAYFLPIKKVPRNNVIALMGICLLLGLTPLPRMLFSAYGETTNDMARVGSYAESEVGFRIEYILEAFFFLFFIIRNYKKIPNDPRHVVLLNIALTFCAILLLFVQSLNGGRLGWYYMIGIIATMTYLCTQVKKSSLTRLGILSVMFVLFIRIVISWGQLLYPYKTFFSNGVRENDQVEMQYEYDHNYDANKFYK